MKLIKYVSDTRYVGHKGREGFRLKAENLEEIEILKDLRYSLLHSSDKLTYDGCATKQVEGLEDELVTEIGLLTDQKAVSKKSAGVTNT